MHGGANVILCGLCIEIITVVIVLFFLARVKKDELGRGFKWAGGILLFLGFLAIACTLTRGIGGMMMMHHGDCHGQECPMMDRGHCGMMHEGMMHDGCGSGCCGHDGGSCCAHDGKCGDMQDGKGCKMDSASGKKCPMCKDKDMGKDKMHNDTVKSIK